MPRSFIQQEPKIINTLIVNQSSRDQILQISTTNKNKIMEFKRLLPNFIIEPISLKINEIQDLDPIKVAEQKAKDAFIANKYNPVLVEDVSFEIKGLNNFPGVFVTFYVQTPEMRKTICEKWLTNQDRSAVARTILAIYDGKEAHTFVGETHGQIAMSPVGTNGWGFDDMFIPNGHNKTFAQMTDKQKDKLSMRAIAIKKFINSEVKLGKYIKELPEPFESELKRLQINKLNKNKTALKFAFTLDAVYGNKINNNFEASYFEPITEVSTTYYDRYKTTPKSFSIGLIVTDVDKESLNLHKNGDLDLWQMGIERRKLALAQRAEYFLKNTNPKVINLLKNYNVNNHITRPNTRHPAIEELMKVDVYDTSYNARAIKELGYKKLSANKIVSRRQNAQTGLFNKIGKYPRISMGIGSMPTISGQSDVILTAILGHMPVFISRNNIFAGNTQLRIDVINETQTKLKSLKLNKQLENIVKRNIGVAIGTNPINDVKEAVKIHQKTGVSLFRIYTINSDPRFIQTAIALRKELGNKVEIFAGQIADKEAAQKLVQEAQVDGIIFGHGGGRQCTSATNGMALTTVEEIYSIVTDPFFNNTTLLVEGGVGRSVGALLILGIDGILYNQQLARGTIETGGLFVLNKAGDFGQPYNGSASAPTMIIEAADEYLKDSRINPSGRTQVPEGKKGFSIYSEKANSMAFWIDEFKHQMARTLADLGVQNISELRKFVKKHNKELLRIVSPEAATTSQAWKNTKD